MLKNIAINKRYLTIAGSILLLVICYQLAFKSTLLAWQTNRQLKSQLVQASDLSYQPGLLARKSKNLDAILSRYHSDSLTFRGNTIAEISRIAGKENVKLSGIPVDDPALHTDQYIIERLVFEGSFTSLVKTLHNLENADGVGVSRSIAIKPAKKDEESPLMMEVLLEITRQ
jgi:hypothetical protein